MSISPSGRIVVVGAGMVGSAVAYSILNQKLAKEILLIDIAPELVKAQALDLEDAGALIDGISVRTADYGDLKKGDIVVITSGAAQKEGQTRLDLLQTNARIMRSVIAGIKSAQKDVYIVAVANPVDILTRIAIAEADMPKNSVFGSGTYLDSGRLRAFLAKKLNAAEESVQAWVLGEHGDSSFPWLSAATVSGKPLSNYLELSAELYEESMAAVRGKAYEIIKGKGSTYFGIGVAVAGIVSAITNNEGKFFPISVPFSNSAEYRGVCLGYPAAISSKGYAPLNKVMLNELEQELLDKSAAVLKSSWESLQ